MTHLVPRPISATAIVHGVATAQRVMAVVGLIFAAATVAELMLVRGNSGYTTLVAAPVVAVVLLALVLVWRPTLLTASLYLVGGAVSSVGVVVLGLGVDPTLAEPSLFALNRAATALVLVGALRGSALSGMVWSGAGLVVAYGSLAVGLAVSGVMSPPGWGPLIVFVVTFVVYATLLYAQRRATRQMPDLDDALQSLERTERQRTLELRAAAVIHDTVLADLAVVSASPGPVPEPTRARLQADMALVRSSSVRRDSPPSPLLTNFGSSLLKLAQDFQWSGVRVDVSGAELVPSTVRLDVESVLLAAARAALDNVVRHSGAHHADLVVGERNGVVTVLIVDDGHGFDPDSVGPDRLGLRTAIRDRVEGIGGSVRIWSGVDGTTVMLTAAVDGGVT